jgi:dihydrodipicolinate synthase/N-acetylneuraminate lyase
MLTSVIAVPPLARNAAGTVSAEENRPLIRHIEGGGVRVLLYGGNAVFYHIRLSEYAGILTMLAEVAAPGTEIVPSAGPGYGVSLDQAAMLRDYPFRTAMVLPHQGLNTPDGVATGLRHFAEAYGRPIVVYIKAEGYLTPTLTAALVRDGIVSWVKYAIVRADERQDPFLDDLTQSVDPAKIVSGMGEQPVIHHLRDRRLAGFTSGCVCVNPSLSAKMLTACQAGDWDEADRIRQVFEPLENLRNEINLTPLLSGLNPEQSARVERVARELRPGPAVSENR